MSWILDAISDDKLKKTDDRNCPFCNPGGGSDVPTKLNACKKHSWANRDWFEAWFANMFEIE